MRRNLCLYWSIRIDEHGSINAKQYILQYDTRPDTQQAISV